jgi:hypothetical protein
MAIIFLILVKFQTSQTDMNIKVVNEPSQTNLRSVY